MTQFTDTYLRHQGKWVKVIVFAVAITSLSDMIKPRNYQTMYSYPALLDQDLLFSPWRLYHKPFWCWNQATRPISQIPQCTCPISHNAPFWNKMVQCMVLNVERQKSRSTLVQVMACCLTAPSHWLNSYGLIISEVCWHSPEGNLTGNAQVSIPDLSFEIVNSPPLNKMAAISQTLFSDAFF